MFTTRQRKELEARIEKTDAESWKSGRCDWCGRRNVSVKLDHTRDALCCKPCIHEGLGEAQMMLDGEITA